MSQEIIDEVLDRLSLLGVECKQNHYNNNVLIATCIFCQNPNWNLEIELSEKFVYHCWACDSSGTANQLLNKVLKLNIQLPTVKRTFSTKISGSARAISMFIQAGNFKDKLNTIKDPRTREIAKKAVRNKYWKFTTAPKIFKYKKLRVYNALLCLGLLKQGVLTVDTAKNSTFKTKQDLFLYNPNNSRKICIVEGPFDIWPHFLFEEVLILTQTSLRREYLDEFFNLRPHKKEIYLCLDKNAERSFVKRLQKSPVLIDRKVYVFQPEKHSPRQSGYVLASRWL